MLPGMLERVCGLLALCVRKDPELTAIALETSAEAFSKLAALQSGGRAWPAPPTPGKRGGEG